MKSILFASLFLFICFLCNEKSGIAAPVPVSGVINGKPFVLGTALAYQHQGVHGVVFNILLAPAGVLLTCEGIQPKTLVMATSPAAVGTYDAKYGMSGHAGPGNFIFTFPVADDSPYNMTIGAMMGQIEGTIRIDSFNSKQIIGGVVSKAFRTYHGKTYAAEISGEFAAALCP